MTIETTSNQARFIGNGVTTVFPFTFLIPSAADLFVYYTDPSGNTSLLPSSAYTVSGLGNANGGSVTYNPGTPIPANSIFLIQRRLPYTQDVDLVNQDGFYPQVVEDGLDSLEMQIQQLVQDQSLNLKVGVTDTSPGSLPAAAQRAGQFLAFDSSGNAIAALPSSGAPISTAMQPVVAAATLAAARTAMGLSAISSLAVGAGLRNDGTNLSVNSPITHVSGAVAVGAAQDLFHYYLDGAAAFTNAKASTLFNGFCYWVEAVNGDATINIDPSDTIAGTIGSGVSWTVPQGMAAFVKTDGVSTWVVEMFGAAQPKTVSGAYPITAADHMKLINHSSGAFGTIVFPAAATLPTKFRCWIQNGEPSNGRGKGVSGLNVNSFTLYPGQGYLVENVGGTLVLVGGIQPFKISSVALFCHQSLGSDNVMVSDGLADGAGAKATQNAVRQQLYQDFNHNGSQPTVTLTGNFLESVTFAGQPINCGVFFWVGSSVGAYTVQPTNSGSPFCWIVGDGAVLETRNVKFSNNGLQCTNIQLHQTAILDLLSGVEFVSAGSAGSNVSTDGAGWTLNINNSYAVSGVASTHINAIGSGVVNHTGSITVTITNTPAYTNWFASTGPCLISLATSITWSGALTAGCQKWQCKSSGSIFLSGNGANVPGSIAGNPAAGSAPTAATGVVTA